MKVFGDEQQLCPCYKESQEFQKLVELKDSGLAVYCYRPRTEDVRQAEAVENGVNTTRDVFILYNKKNVKITSSQLTSELEKENISCPRCRKTYEHAQQLVQEVKSIDKKMVMGLCDHCRMKVKGSKNPSCSCDKIVKKFMSVKGKQKEDTKQYFTRDLNPLKMTNFRKDTMVNKQKQNTYSDFLINRHLNLPASHEPEIQQMFSPTHLKSDYTELSETNLKKGYVKQAVAFIQPIESVKTSSAHIPHESKNINSIIPGTSLVESERNFLEISVGIQPTEPVKTSFAHTPHESKNINALIPSTSLEDSETTFVETYVKELPKPSLKDRKQEEIFEDRPSMAAKEALKRRHDLSLRQMMRLEKDSVVPYSVSKRPDIYETPKIAPWAQKEPTSKYYVESEMDIKIPTLKHNRGPRGTRDLDYISNRDVKFRSTKASQDSYYDPKKLDKYQHDKIKQGFYNSEERPKNVNKFIADEQLKLQRSIDKISHKANKPEQQHMTKSKSEPIKTVRNVPEHQYSFFFPKVMEKEEKKVKGDVSSSHLIKDIQEKFRLQAARAKKIQEKERQKQLEQSQKKKLAREEKKLQAEEKKRQAVEDQTKLDEEQTMYEKAQKKLAEDKKYSEVNLESKLAVKE